MVQKFNSFESESFLSEVGTEHITDMHLQRRTGQAQFTWLIQCIQWKQTLG